MRLAQAIILAAVLAPGVEYVLLALWVRWYFDVGLEIFRQEVNAGDKPLDVAGLESSFSSGIFAAMAFNAFDAGNVGFRERLITFGRKVQYAPVMHGMISRGERPGTVVVRGLLNWSWPVFALIVLLLTRFNPVFLGFLVLIAGVSYAAQRHRYQEIARYFGPTA